MPVSELRSRAQGEAARLSRRALWLARAAAVGLAAAALPPAVAVAAGDDPARQLLLDPGTCRVDFALGATLHRVRGSFRLVEGRIDFDTGSGRASGRVVIDAASGDTGNRSRDRKMRGKVLESERFPEIRFLPERIAVRERGEAEAAVELAGSVEIHGVREPLTIPAVVRREGNGVRIAADFTIPYVRWGMRDPSLFVLRVSPEVAIHLDLFGQLDPP